MATSGYPNVKARVRWTQLSPALPRREGVVVIWLSGHRFRVRDEAGREVSTILGDLSQPSGLGVPARTMEEIMDVHSWARTAHAATELFGDLSTGSGSVHPAGRPAWPMEATKLAPAAEQLLAGALDPTFERRRDLTLLGRPAVEYHGVVTGNDGVVPFHSDVTRVVSAPFLLRSDVRHATLPDELRYTREVVSLEPGAVTDADLAPPP